MYKIEITERAEHDLFEIFDYISSVIKEPKTAVEQLQRIRDAIYSLEIFPKRHELIKFEMLQYAELRKLIIDNYLVFYKIQNDIVYIVRVLYAKREWQGLV